MELNTLIRIECYKQDAPKELKKNKQPCSGNLMLRKFKAAIVERTSVRLHPMRTEVRATLEQVAEGDLI